MMKKRETKKSKRGLPRPRVAPFWRSRLFLGGMVLLLGVLAAGGGWQVWKSGWVPRAAERVKWEVIAASSQLGLKVNEILVVGRGQTTQKELLAAVQLARGAPILAFDLNAARKRVEKLPWIKAATIERMLPDTLLLNVQERQPLALWQHKGVFALIDTEGNVILKTGLERYSDLLVVVGADAPAHAAELLKTLATEPQLMTFVRAAIRVGGRRWNLRLKGDIDVRLPEDDTASAWTRLAEYEKTHQVLERDVQVLDLRLPDRLIVRRAPKGPVKVPEKIPEKRQQT
ncbi:MAG: FtsQ-type POTRA domain-containing protein [Rhodospirillales bacterium]|nr:FtsQ-type POTRA domain-containing protein [Rhodospirillales bacterium]